MNCKICGTENETVFSGRILQKYYVRYYQCSLCDFVQTEEPFWLNEAYNRSINLSDTGYMVRNLFYARRLSVLLFLLFGKEGKFLDYAGGYGVFVRIMRDYGFDFCWDDKYTQNIFATGFEWDQYSKVHAITLFEVFEHFVNPMDEVKNLLQFSDTIIFSTDLIPEPLPKPKDWWYFGLDHGQHVSLFSKKALHQMASHFGLRYYNLGSLHILSRKKIPKLTLLAFNYFEFGLFRIISRIQKSKTWYDYELMTKNANEDSV